MPIVLLKVWSWLKAHWYIPVALIAILIGMLTKSKDVVDWAKVIGKARDSHKAELEAIERSRAAEAEARAAAERRMAAARKQVTEEFARNKMEIDSQKQKEIDRILKKTKEDPVAMQAEIEKKTGFRVVVID